MLPEQFRAWSVLLAEPVLLVRKDGQVLAANEAVRHLCCDSGDIEHKTLFDLSTTDEQQIRNFLQLCSRNRQPVFTVMAIKTSAEEQLECRCDGMLARHESEGSETTLLLKLTPKTDSVRNYQLVNEKINELNREIQRRKTLEEKLQERNESIRATLASIAAQKKALELLVDNAPMPDVLDALCEAIEDQSQHELIATILLVDEDGKRLRSIAGRRAPAEYSQAVDGVPIGPNIGSCGTAAFRGEQVIVSDINSDPLWQDYRDLANRYGLRACWSTPIFSSTGGVLGTFAVYAMNPVQPNTDQLSLIDVLARTAGIAVERRRDEEALRIAARRKDEFLATLAHELRNPLAPIRTGLEIMKLSKDDPDTLEDVRDTMERQTLQLITLVDDLLDVSRITRGKFELRLSHVKLADVLESAVEAATPFMTEAGHQFSVSIPDTPIFLNADPHRLTQVVSNLLNNAAKYTPDRGHIALTVELQDDSVEICVADNGIGIPSDMRERVFEMFAQINHRADKATSGLGIGLTLVKSLVEMHDGQVTVDSPGQNQGSQFRVRLPLLKSSFEMGQESDTDGASCQRTYRVLIADDNRDAATLLSIIVKTMGHEVRRTADGKQAIEVASDFRPHVVLMDLGMPIMGGWEAARHIRNQPWGKNMTLVAITGWGQSDDKRKAMEAGFDYHFTKPASSSDLEQLFRDLAESPEPVQHKGC